MKLFSVVAVLGASAAVGVLDDWKLLAIVGVGVLGLVGVVVFAKASYLGLAGLLAASLIVPIEIGTGTQTTINPAVVFTILLVGIWVLQLVADPEAKLQLGATPIPTLLALCGIGLLALIQSRLLIAQMASAPLRAQLGGLFILWMSVGVFILVFHQVHEVKWLRWLTWLFIALAVLVMVIVGIPQLSEVSSLLIKSGAIGGMFWTWAIAMMCGQLLANKRLTFLARIGLLGIVVFAFYIVFYQGRTWVSGWMPPLLAIAVILWLSKPRLSLYLTLAGIAIAITNTQALVDAVLVGDNRYSLITRLQAWSIVGKLTLHNPLLGLGPANYYYAVRTMPIQGYFVHFSSHNNYVDLFAQYGVLGLLVFGIFLGQIGLVGLGQLGRADEGFTRGYLIGGLGGLVATAFAGFLGDWFLPFVYNIGFAGLRSSILPWFFLGGFLVIQRSIGRHAAHGEAVPSETIASRVDPHPGGVQPEPSHL
jgi:hypothetical protein